VRTDLEQRTVFRYDQVTGTITAEMYGQVRSADSVRVLIGAVLALAMSTDTTVFHERGAPPLRLADLRVNYYRLDPVRGAVLVLRYDRGTYTLP